MGSVGYWLLRGQSSNTLSSIDIYYHTLSIVVELKSENALSSAPRAGTKGNQQFSAPGDVNSKPPCTASVAKA